MKIIKKADFIDSIADSLQYISYYHPLDFVQAMHAAYQREKNQAAKDAIGQILINSRMSAIGKRPICQDTGIVNVFIKIGMDCRFDSDMTVQEMVDAGVRRAYLRSQPIPCACRWSPTRPPTAETPATTARRWSTPNWSPATAWRS